MQRNTSQLGLSLALLVAVVGSSAIAGCSDAASVACRVGADCASGVCSSAGQCVFSDALETDVGVDGVIGGDASTSDGDVEGSDGSEDTSSIADAGDDGAADTTSPDVVFMDLPPVDADGTPTCSPNGDYVITKAESPILLDASVTFRTALNAPVDLKGSTTAEGERLWALDGALAGDTDLVLETEPVKDQWFADLFAGATYTTRLTAQNMLKGVFETTVDGLLLRGVVSPEGGTFRTELTYDPPVALLRYPLEVGKSWTEDADIDGPAEGIPCFSVGGCSERYRMEVDAKGALQTPYGNFRVVRVRVELERKVGFQTTVTRSFLFVAECFGTVATVVSEAGETTIEFDTASEIRRLAP
ncbi:MAG: hypothetical protein IV100_17045 [Myxococcales bacterium]|nr:hypothetical protein [Myxococcales bacterium]